MSAETLNAPGPVEKQRPSRPTFFQALRGVWLFTWKSQLTWRRLALAALGLLGLPVLIYLTTPSAQAWAESHRLQMGQPAAYLSGFAKRLTRIGAPLQTQQQTEMVRIIAEEFGRAEAEWNQGAAADASVERRRELAEQCHERILGRVQPILDQRQFSEFQTYQRRHRHPQPQASGELGWGRTTSFYHCLIDLYFFIILPLNCVRMCGALIRDELEAGTLSFLTTRPLSRARLLLLKYLSQTAWLQIWLLVQTGFVFAAGTLRSIPELRTLLPIFLGAQLLAVFAWSALGLFLGQVSKRYMALGLLYGLIVEMGIGRIPTNINSLSLMRHLQGLLAHHASLQSLFSWPPVDLSRPIIALVLGTTVFLMGATLLFTYKEYHPTTEMQK